MPTYRFFQLSQTNKISGVPTDIDFDGDEPALAHAAAFADGHAIEVWDGKRLVGRAAATSSGDGPK
jgi:hypothetical protein